MEGVAAVGGSILCACLDVILDRLHSIDWLKFLGQGHILDHLKKWEKVLMRIYYVLDDAEERQTTNPWIEIWLSHLKNLAYDLEDLLDELATEVQQRKLENEHYKDQPSKMRRLFSSISGKVNPRTVKFNLEMVSKIEEITARFDEIVKQKDDLYLGESSRFKRRQVSERLPSTSLVDETKAYGREEDKKAVIELLRGETGDTDIAVIPITGMAGVGKTTLAQLVYNESSMEFDLKAWVYVGEDFDILRITKAILQSENGDYKDLNFFQEKLKRKLFRKKFLVILDDVWCENYEQWTLFRGPFEAGASGSRILITTRNQEVALMTGTIPAYPLKELAYDKCLSVFAQHALGAANFNQHLDLEEIGKEIVKRCRGLPLAAKALGGLLRGKRNVNAWKEVSKSELWDLPDSQSYVLPALRLSYLYLPPHLKQCFAYCAIFPKDYQFDRDELVLLWMAEGFLRLPKGMEQAEGLGHRCFDELLSRSFFQQSNDNKSRYVMHDLINDLARFVSRETCFHLVDDALECAKSYANVRHSSFIPRWSNIFRRFEPFYEMKKLRTFLSVQQSNFGCYLSRKVLHDLLPKLKCLRTLSLTGCWCMELPSSVSELKQLRYLDLSGTDIQRLPESLGKLFNLETLKLHHCGELIELPNSICDLLNLQYLDISDTYKLKALPFEIGNLINLRMLSKFIVGEGNCGLRISELKRFSKLEGKLLIKGLENVVDRDADFVNLKKKHRLLELDLVWTSAQLDSDFANCKSRNPIHELEVLNSLEPLPNLSSLSIIGFSGSNFPSWIGDPIFTNMVNLKLQACLYITSLPPLGRLPSLKELSIIQMDGVKDVGSEFYEDCCSFSCLETLRIEYMKEWEQWSWCNGLSEDSVGKFPKLRKFQIVDCPKLVGKLPSFLPCLEELDIWCCPRLVDSPKVLPSLQRLSINGCPEAVLRNLCNVPCLNKLNIERMLGLVSLNESHIQALVALRNFEIGSCDELTYLWADGTNLDHLTSLRHLFMFSCQHLVSLVKGKEGLLPCNLESFEVYNCDNLQELPDGLHGLNSLKVFRVIDCGELISFPARGLPYSLKHVTIIDCPYLEVLCNSEMSDLESLEIRNCYSVSCFPNYKLSDSVEMTPIQKGRNKWTELLYSGFSFLTYLVISDCNELVSFPECEPHLPSLISLTIFHCKRLQSLSDHMQILGRLQNLQISNCDKFQVFPERGLLHPNLVSLQIENCRNLQSLPNQLHPKLTELVIQSCKNLSQPMENWGLRRLTSLKKLRIGYTRSTSNMITFPDNEGMILPTSLTDLIIHGFKNLESISRGIQNLTSLRSFFIDDCLKLKSFPNEGLPPTVESLVILLCPLLASRCLEYRGDYWPLISHIPFLQLKFRQ